MDSRRILRRVAQVFGWIWIAVIALTILSRFSNGDDIAFVLGRVIFLLMVGIPGYALVRWGRRAGSGDRVD